MVSTAAGNSRTTAVAWPHGRAYDGGCIRSRSDDRDGNHRGDNAVIPVAAVSHTSSGDGCHSSHHHDVLADALFDAPTGALDLSAATDAPGPTRCVRVNCLRAVKPHPKNARGRDGKERDAQENRAAVFRRL